MGLTGVAVRGVAAVAAMVQVLLAGAYWALRIEGQSLLPLYMYVDNKNKRPRPSRQSFS